MNHGRHPDLGVTARATIVEHEHDGDTIPLELHLPARIRIRNLWCPEVRSSDVVAKSMARAAQLHLMELLPPGSQVVIHIPTEHAKGPQSIMSFGRVLADMWRAVDGINVAEQMIEDGFGWRTRAEQDAAVRQAKERL